MNEPFVQFLWQKYRYFPYEREFAKSEVGALLGQIPGELVDGLSVPQNGLLTKRYRRFTYFREIVLPSGRKIVPDQALLEASSRPNGTGRVGKTIRVEIAGRQSTRYSAHGLHEYRGKFNPQVVRAIGNMLALRKKAWVLDPFCGSGTTLLESAHVGWNAVGTDLNPLAVMISNAKLRAIHAPPVELSGTAHRLFYALRRSVRHLSYNKPWSEMEMRLFAGVGWEDSLPNFHYLTEWFTRPVLAQATVILGEIGRIASSDMVPVFRVILSDLLRDVSLQEPEDLRIRRRKNPAPNYPLIPTFMSSLEAKIGSITRAINVLGKVDGFQEAHVADNRVPFDWMNKSARLSRIGGFDAVITSPPYATALPYIDTQRLSLCLLGLISSNKVMETERSMTGTREINERRRKGLEESLRNSRTGNLPENAVTLCKRMLELTALPGNGFRRRNMPALAYGYFSDMALAFENIHAVVRPRGVFALVVGRNRTVLGGEEVLIDTPIMLADIAGANGWRMRKVIELDAYKRFDIHRRNSINTECLILLERA